MASAFETVSISPLRHPLDPKAKGLWIEALRSGKFEQGTGHLSQKYWDRETGEFRNDKQRYCCLGVAMEALGKKKSLETPLAITFTFEGGNSSATLSADQVNLLGMHYDDQYKFTKMNDHDLFTFEQIADWLEDPANNA